MLCLYSIGLQFSQVMGILETVSSAIGAPCICVLVYAYPLNECLLCRCIFQYLRTACLNVLNVVASNYLMTLFNISASCFREIFTCDCIFQYDIGNIPVMS